MNITRQKTPPFAEIPTADFVGIILDGGERADEAMYYLLRHILYRPLKRRYEMVQHLLLDGFDDILDDFFFHLRDGNAICSGHDKATEETGRNMGNAHPTSDNQLPYPSLRCIRNRQAFVQWMLRTFRNYLNVRINKESPFVRSCIPADNLPVSNSGYFPDNSPSNFPYSSCDDLPFHPDNDLPISGDDTCNSSANYSNHSCSSGYFSAPDTSPSILTDEQKLSTASRLIAYAHQEMPPRDGFILFRALLTMLNKRQSLPNEEVAEALGMTDTSYRVAVHRVKDRLSRFRTRLLKGEPLHLDDLHQQMAQRINEDFLYLYPTLLHYCDQIINDLDPKRADAVKRLRQDHLAATGNLLHEPATPYTAKPSKAALWNLLERVIGG